MSKPHPLRAYRDKAEISAAALAALLGVTRQSVYRIENGQQEPSVALMRQIAKVTKGEVTEEQVLRACLAASAPTPSAEPAPEPAL